MFWNRKIKCPIDLEDKKWVEDKVTWLNTNIIDIRRQPTILPTKKFFNINYSGKERDAFDTLDIMSDYFQIDTNMIQLKFYSEKPAKLDTHLRTQRDEGGTAGLYILDDDENTIMIEEQQLSQPNSLIATLAHELSHYIIMYEKGYHFEETENEFLTDLATIGFGFGIFLGNTKFNFKQWQSGDGWGGWSASTQGYLPEQVIAYTMAEIQNRKQNLEPDWVDHLHGDFKKQFKKSLKYIAQENG